VRCAILGGVWSSRPRAFYDQTGTIRDVVQSHLFQILTNLTMDPPIRIDSESISNEKAKILKAIDPLAGCYVVRGQFGGYKSEKGVGRRLADRDLRRAAIGNQILALAGCADLHPRWKVPAGRFYVSVDPFA
jgi:Glucose-6-phosphate dehydrogenase, C-terminal domain